MNNVNTSRGASFGRSLLVALGWYGSVIAAVVVGWSGIPAAPDRDCSTVLSCLTPLQAVGLGLMVFGVPVLAALLVSTLVVTRLLARRVPSPVLTGTLSALGSVVVLAAVGAVWQGVR